MSASSFSFPYYGFQIGGNPVDISSYQFIRGNRYRFVDGRASGSGHPFFISDQGRVTASTFAVTSTGTFNTGILSGGSLEFQIPLNFSGSLTYYCVVHPSMTNAFMISN